MPLTKLQFKPGVVKDTTAYSNEGGWVDSDLIRFRFGYPEKIGGWESRTNDTIVGTPRALHSWQSLNNTPFIGIGTHQKYYIESSGNIFNITPIRTTFMIPAKPTGNQATTSLGTVTVETENFQSALLSNVTGLVGNLQINFYVTATASVGNVTVTTS
tara:strand:- start:3508 stop:3981 length:474 start_codon:yes stop_codon:yes gene_type:complete